MLLIELFSPEILFWRRKLVNQGTFRFGATLVLEEEATELVHPERHFQFSVIYKELVRAQYRNRSLNW